ncbi:chondroitin sulfate synthase 1 [Schistocerca gregaria]|uniref:chondroitin sulfate synthase 1 n=1 Tax=Schistocerca gregaria TaxID=7010 RepID=UPI00211DB4AA|nr:chondroitin sulfate synthase 1 [Schistocerca gregaria]
MVANGRERRAHRQPGDGDAFLCHPSTELLTFRPSASLPPPPSRRTAGMAAGARRRRGASAALGVVLGLAAGLMVAAPRSIFVGRLLRTDNTTGAAPGGGSGTPCAPSAGSPWPAPQPLRQQPPVAPLSDAEDPLQIIGLTDPAENVHNSPRTLLLAGVMTAQKYVDTRAVAVLDTWGRQLPGRVAFFSSWASRRPPDRPDLPLVRLRGVDDSYPPQKKSFLMLHYMWRHFGDRFEWFLRADDDVYVRADRLEKLLRSVDSRQPRFIGQAGRGNEQEFGLLSLEYDENFCMGGPGVLMSRETLARVAPHIQYCLQHLYTTHEDVELGRCVQRFAGIPCTWSYEMQTILYHNSSGSAAFTGNLKQKEVHRAITLHPVKHHEQMYRIHNYMQALKVQDLQQESINLHRDIMATMKYLNVPPHEVADVFIAKDTPLFPAKEGSPHYLGDSAMLGLNPSLHKFHPRREQDILKWDFISRSIYSDTNNNPRRRIETPLREGLEDVVREVMDMINMFSKQRGRVIEYREILYGYHRVNPMYGAEYILDLLMVYKKYRGRKMTVPVRRHVYLQQQFTGLQIRETVDGEEVQSLLQEENEASVEELQGLQKSFRDAFENGLLKIGESFPFLFGSRTSDKSQSIRDKKINFILPLSGRFNTFKRFMSVFEEVCLMNEEAVSLIIILFPSDKENRLNDTVTLVQKLQGRYNNADLTIYPVLDTFARAIALEIGTAHCKDDDLIFFIDVDMVFTSAALERIRINTIQGKQAYFPIVFSEFDPSVVYSEEGLVSSPNHFRITEDSGYWRQYGFGIASVYKSDLRRIGGFDTSIRGWGKEDVDLFDKFILAAKNISVFRAVDPHLIHVFHIVDCDPNLEEAQLEMCKKTRADTYGGVHQLARYIYSHPDIVQYARNKRKQDAPS